MFKVRTVNYGPLGARLGHKWKGTDREDEISDTLLFLSHVESKTGQFEIVVMSLERFNAQLKVKTTN